MIGIDTNVLVRYFAQDDEDQSRTATRVIEALTPEDPGYVALVVLVESIWVLSRAYKAKRARIGEIVETLLRARELIVESKEAAFLALSTYRSTRADFADALIAHGAKLAGCREVVTLDSEAASTTGMRLLST